jgi:hypothetical protein
MVQDQFSKFPNAVWVQIYKDKMQLMDRDGNITQTLLPPVPYAQARSIIADYAAASDTLKQLVPISLMQRLFGSTALLQIMDLPEDGLTALEERALLELGYRSSAQNVFLYDAAGHVLSTASLSDTYPMTHLKIFLVIVIIVMIASILFLNL